MEKIIHSQNSHLPFAAIATFLALNQILLQEANSIFSLPSFAFYEIGNKLGREQRKGTKGHRNVDMPVQPGGDREVRRGRVGTTGQGGPAVCVLSQNQ